MVYDKLNLLWSWNLSRDWELNGEGTNCLLLPEDLVRIPSDDPIASYQRRPENGISSFLARPQLNRGRGGPRL